MTRSILCLSVALAACASKPAHAPDAPPPKAPAHAPAASGNKRAMEISDYFHCAGVSAPAVSHDGKRIAFAVKRQDLESGKSGSEIWIADVDGQNAHALTSGKKNDTGPLFSPDDKQLLFSSNRSGSGQLWTMPLDGGEPKQLTDFSPGLDSPVWSPDGRFIAATSDLFPEAGTDVDANARLSKGLDEGKLKVHVADELLYRHWTSWGDGKVTHIVLVDATSGKVVKDLTPGPWTSPVFERTSGSLPAALSSRQRSAVRRHCHTIAFAKGRRVSASQRTVVSRWFVIPIPATSFAGSPARTSSNRRFVTRQISSASCSTQPGFG